MQALCAATPTALSCRPHFSVQPPTLSSAPARPPHHRTARRAARVLPREGVAARATSGGKDEAQQSTNNPASPQQQESSPQQQPPPPGVEDDVQLEGFEGLSPDEDDQVPGSYADAMNPNSKLGKAVKAACAELEELNALEEDVLAQAQDALRRLGVKGDSVDAIAKPPKQRDTKAGLDELESLDLGVMQVLRRAQR